MTQPLLRRVLPGLLLLLLALAPARTAAAREQWSPEQANAWYAKRGWPVGCNFSTSTAINQLEMFQAETFDAATIDRELGWAEGLGFNSVRVFLHDLLWKQDAQGFVKRLDQFLSIADKHHIRVMLVLFDSVWDPEPALGTQRAPKPHVHNSGWVQSPGAKALQDPSKWGDLEAYVKGVVGRFHADPRVDAWDIINEPDNPNKNSYGSREPANKPELALKLMEQAFRWARDAGPSQPLTSGVWQGDWSEDAKLSPVARFQLTQSDVISFHCYDPLPGMKARVDSLRRFNRPLLCTEYMARPRGSTFDPILGYLKEQHVGAYNWGFVAGKTNTIYPWDSWQQQYSAEPPVWFHDIFRQDGKPYDPKEVQYIRQVTEKARR